MLKMMVLAMEYFFFTLSETQEEEILLSDTHLYESNKMLNVIRLPGYNSPYGSGTAPEHEMSNHIGS